MMRKSFLFSHHLFDYAERLTEFKRAIITGFRVSFALFVCVVVVVFFFVFLEILILSALVRFNGMNWRLRWNQLFVCRLSLEDHATENGFSFSFNFDFGSIFRRSQKKIAEKKERSTKKYALILSNLLLWNRQKEKRSSDCCFDETGTRGAAVDGKWNLLSSYLCFTQNLLISNFINFSLAARIMAGPIMLKSSACPFENATFVIVSVWVLLLLLFYTKWKMDEIESLKWNQRKIANEGWPQIRAHMNSHAASLSMLYSTIGECRLRLYDK